MSRAVERAAPGVAPHEDLRSNTDLRCREADPGRGVHRLDHVGDKVAQFRIKGVDGIRDPMQDRLARDADRQDARCAPRLERASTTLVA